MNNETLAAEILNEANDNDGIKRLVCRKNGNIAVTYNNGFNNEWLASYGGGQWDAKTVRNLIIKAEQGL